ncbi:SKA1 protein, partial [Cephalopterus ornatus]|nr:SKA1 protein [Cephalopterus ornatus]
MESTVMEDLCLHINSKISDIKKNFHFKKIGEEERLKRLLHNIGKDIIVLYDLLNKMENEVSQQEKLTHLLQELQQAAERDLKEAKDLLVHIPPDLPKPTRNCIIVPTVKQEEQKKVAEPEPAKKPEKKKRVIKEIPLLMAEEYEVVPVYLKGRLACDQINAVVEEMNKAVLGKYEIMHQPLKSLSFAARNLYNRFMQEETKDTKGEYFIVEADIKMFTQLKMDKRFHSILCILRHCRRVREVRGSKLVRYII